MPLLWISAAFILGNLLAGSIKIASIFWGLLAVIGIGFVFIQKRLRSANPDATWLTSLPISYGILIIALCVGALRYQSSRFAPGMDDLAWYNDGGRAIMVGVVEKPPDQREKLTLLTVRVKEILAPANALEGFRQVSGTAILFLPAGGSWEYGDILRIKGAPVTPPEGEEFSYRAYLAQNGIFTIVRYPDVAKTGEDKGKIIPSFLYRVRETAYRFILRSYSQPEAGLLSGILLGIDGNLPEDLEQDFKDTGTTHILVISGFNIAILAETLTLLLTNLKLRHWQAFFLNVTIIFAYTFMVGGDAPVMRAAIMGVVALLGKYLGRRSTGINSLVFTASVMCLVTPDLPWNISFQLSFAATLGVMVFGGKLENWLRNWLAGRLSQNVAEGIATRAGEYFLMTVAAQLTTLPIIAYHFQRISLSSFLANIFVLPAQPLVMITGGISTILGVVYEPLGRLAALVAWGPLAYTQKVVTSLAGVWRGVIPVENSSPWMIVLYYAILFGLPWIWSKFAGLRRQLTWSTAAIGLGLISVVIWKSILPVYDQRLHLIVLAAPGGPAYLIKAPEGGIVLIGGSTSGIELNRSLEMHLAGRERTIDYWLLTSQDQGHLIGMIGLLDRYTVKNVLYSDQVFGSKGWSALQLKLESQGAQFLPLKSGQLLDMGKQAGMHVLANPDRGTALLVAWKNFNCLIPGGTDPVGYDPALFEKFINPDVLVLQEPDLSEARKLIWQELHPQMMVVSGRCPADWGWNAPLCMDNEVHDWISLTTDGKIMWLEAAQR